MARVILALLIVLAASPAKTDDLSEFNAAVEQAASHQRAAIAYLDAGAADLASQEIGHMRQAWSAVTARKRPPALNRDPQLYTTTMLDVATRLVGVSILLDSGRPDAARKSLLDIRASLSALRKTNGIAVLADCIADANAAMDWLMAYNDDTLDWKSAAIADAARTYRDVIDRCDALASADVRTAPNFRQPIDGARDTLSRIPKAISDRDKALLRRLLVALRSFSHLLSSRYG